jgi:hypothetical protein
MDYVSAYPLKYLGMDECDWGGRPRRTAVIIEVRSSPTVILFDLSTLVS